MASFSPQAGHYYEILTSLNSAIDIHRAKRLEERKRLTSQYVDQVLTFDMENGTPQGEQTSGDGPLPANGFSAMDADGGVPDLTGNDLLAYQSGGFTPYGMNISEGFPWPADDLEIDWQPFAPFLDDLG